MSISNNFKYLALARGNGVIEMHDMDRLASVWETEPEKILGGGIKSLDFSPDGTKLLVTSGSNNVGLWKTESGAIITSDLKHKSSLAMGEWSERGYSFLTASRQGEIRLYETPNPQGEDYLSGIEMTPIITSEISNKLSNRTIKEGRIVNNIDYIEDHKNLPNIYQFNNKLNIQKKSIVKKKK